MLESIYICLKEKETEKIILRFVEAMVYAPRYTLDQFSPD
jgi:hypothetical protein